ncbi:MAG: conjugal transfer protein TraG N-terminal domain-containing protein [Sulfuricurvum sp.]|jgi:conjugal transfer mating pair stabilization protein TraG|uniref:conjugal transfer protein TraG N-terminal domain-containing protein n=1 Tax=Sulfuricurvum sp. TaxID=2025608 RepID=UPI0025E557E6|nr:conjugal transfer protein TraG N-terminal domain-containing protein [Sulfuricurvum sp.]MCK9372453.1 conjugal transfer protein TraG N-terminal domain-containing protein [Sulfuricurvum sp.]
MIKRFLFLLLMLSIPVFAGSDYFITVSSSEEVDWYWTVFNAIPMILGSDSYMTLLRLVFLMGGFLVLAQMVLNAGKDAQGGLINFTKFHILGMAVLTLAFSDHSTVIIKAEYPTTYYNSYYNAPSGIAIDNIPTPLAFAFKFFNSMGRETVGLFEQAFSSVSPVPGQELGGAYSAQKYGYGSSLRNNLKLLNMDMDGALGMALDEFFSDCVYIPYSSKGMDGQVHLEEISNSDNIIYLMGQWINGGETIGGVAAGDYTGYRGGELMTCKDFYNQLTTIDIAQFLAKDHSLATNPLDPLGKMTEQDMGMLLKSRAVPASDFQQIALQAGVMNSIARNDSLPTGVVYAAGKQRADFNLNNISQGYYLSEMLPVMQMMLRGLLYAIFPFILVVTLLPGGLKVIGQYGQTMLWVESWGVLAAILNHVICKYTEVTVGGGLTLNNSAEIMGTTASMAGLAGYLYASLPALSWLLLKGSGTMLGNISGGLSASFAKNASTASIAADRKAQASQEQVSKDLGREVSMAEAMHYQSIASGIKEGANVAVDKTAGNNKVGERAKYEASMPYANYDEKLKVLNASKPSELIEFEKTMTGNNMAKDKALVENTTRQNFTDTGINEATDKKNNSYNVNKYGQDVIQDVKNFDTDKKNLTNLEEKRVLQESPLGVEGGIVAKAGIDKTREVTAIKEKMKQTGGSTDDIGKTEGEKDSLDFSKTSGFVGGTTVKQQNDTGKHNAAGDNSKAEIIKKWGQSKVEDSNFHSENKEKVENLTADNFYNKQPGGQDKYLEQLKKFDVTGTNSKFKGIDANGDNTVSDKEIKKYGNVETKQNQADFITEQHEQKEKEAAAARMKHANDPRLRSGANSGGEFGNNSGSKLAGYGNAMVNAGTTLDPYQKDIDLTTKRNLDNEGVNVSKLAENKTVDVVEKTAHTENRGETEATAFLDEKDRNYKEAYQKNLDEAHEKGLSGTAAINYASKETAKDIKMHDSDNGKRLYSSEVALQKEAINEKKAAITGGDKKVEEYANKAQALNAYKKQANKFPAGSPQRKMLETQASKLENDMNDIKAHAGDKGAFTQKVNALHKLNKQERDVETNVAKKMESEGHLTRTKDGGLHFSDAKEEFENSPHLARKTAALKGAGDANKLETTGDDGKDIVKTTNSKGELVTNHRASKKGNVEEGDFRSDITYHAKDKLDISDEALQYSTTGLNVVKEVTQFVPAAKVLKLGGKVDDVVDPKEVASAAMRTKITRGY